MENKEIDARIERINKLIESIDQFSHPWLISDMIIIRSYYESLKNKKYGK